MAHLFLMPAVQTCSECNGCKLCKEAHITRLLPKCLIKSLEKFELSLAVSGRSRQSHDWLHIFGHQCHCISCPGQGLSDCMLTCLKPHYVTHMYFCMPFITCPDSLDQVLSKLIPAVIGSLSSPHGSTHKKVSPPTYLFPGSTLQESQESKVTQLQE